MTTRSIVWIQAVLGSIAILAAASPAKAQLTFLEDTRVVSATATYQGVPNTLEDRPLIPFTFFNSIPQVRVERDEPCQGDPEDTCVIGFSESFAQQVSQVSDGGFEFSGTTGGGWDGAPSGDYSFISLTRFRFRIDWPVDFHFAAHVEPGDWPNLGLGLVGGHVSLEDPHGLRYFYLDTATPLDTLTSGRLPPGEYIIEGISSGTASEQTFSGATYYAQFDADSVPAVFVAHQPGNQTVACGGTATFSVGASVPGMTYQWRKNLVPLSNGPHVSGATGSTLALSGVCSSDAGFYDCVVTGTVGGVPVSEPSRLAQLGISTATGVQVDPTGGAPVATLSAPSPNPFRVSTSLRYTLPEATSLRAAVYNVAGVKVRSFPDRVVTGSGTITWDGTLRSGARAPRGIYFLRIDAGKVQETKKVLLIE